MIFLAHLAPSLGIPTGVLIAAAIILRKKVVPAMKVRRQAKRAAVRPQAER